jgi:hypothetical protein
MREHRAYAADARLERILTVLRQMSPPNKAPIFNLSSLCWLEDDQPVLVETALLSALEGHHTGIYVWHLRQNRCLLVTNDTLRRMSPLEALAHSDLLPEQAQPGSASESPSQ